MNLKIFKIEIYLEALKFYFYKYNFYKWWSY